MVWRRRRSGVRFPAVGIQRLTIWRLLTGCLWCGNAVIERTDFGRRQLCNVIPITQRMSLPLLQRLLELGHIKGIYGWFYVSSIVSINQLVPLTIMQLNKAFLFVLRDDEQSSRRIRKRAESAIRKRKSEAGVE
jgi:hypothetical protein